MRNIQGKKFKTIPEQTEWLIDSKNITITNKEEANNYLMLNSYYNFINSTKIHYIDYDEDINTRIYKKSEFLDWVKTFESNIQLETKLMMLSLREEEIIANYIGNLVHLNIIDNVNEEFNSFVFRKLSNTKLVKSRYKKSEVSLPNYREKVLDNTWAFVHEVMLRDKIDIINKMSNAEKKNLNKLLIINCNIEDEMDAFRDLRNCLAHNTPINIYFTSPSSSKQRATRIKVVSKLANKKGSGLKNIINENIIDCKSTLNIKKSKIKNKVL